MMHPWFNITLIFFISFQVFALEKLNKIVDVFWAEISEAIDKM